MADKAPTAVASQVMDYGRRLSVRLSDGRVLRFDIAQLAGRVSAE